MDLSKHVNTRASDQRERTPGRTDEVENSEGGFVHQVDDWARLDRFLILGSEGGTYYISERDLTKDNAEATIRLIKEDGQRVVNTVVRVSDAGRAHKNEVALFVLAMCAKLGDEATRKLACGVLPEVARIGTHLFTFVKYCEAFGGWGPVLRRAIARWYNNKDPDELAYQLLKYRQRDGWSHRDLLRLAHVIPKNDQYNAIFKATCHPEEIQTMVHENKLPRIYGGYAQAQAHGMAPSSKIVRDFNLSWEMLPTEWLKDSAVNRQLLLKMPLMATIRQLGRLSANGTIKPMSQESMLVAERLVNQEKINKSRIHPMHYLLAAKNYTAGHGFRSDASWTTDNKIVAALDEGLGMSFDNVVPTNKNFLLGIDVSSSMRQPVSGSNISCAEAAGAMAVVIARTEPSHYMHGFCSAGGHRVAQERALAGFVDLGIGSTDTVDSVMNKVQKRNFGGTDCALPMLYASANNIMVDVFIVLTDNETWAGSIKPAQALVQYRQTHNPNAKLVVVAMTGNKFTIADPNDADMLDVVGFDANVLLTIQEFSR